jgi:hypothetical protein
MKTDAASHAAIEYRLSFGQIQADDALISSPIRPARKWGQTVAVNHPVYKQSVSPVSLVESLGHNYVEHSYSDTTGSRWLPDCICGGRANKKRGKRNVEFNIKVKEQIPCEIVIYSG